MALICSTTSTVSPPNSSIHHQPPPSKNCLAILRSLAITLLILLLLFVTAVSIAWLLLHPHLPSVKAESLSASGFSISNSGFTAIYDLQITFANPNKKINLWIDHFSLRIVYKNIVVSRVDSEPHKGIVILRKMQSQVKFQMNTTELNDKKRRKIVRDMRGDWSRGLLSFDMMINIRVKYRSGVLPSKQKLLKVSCQNLIILFPSPKDFGYLHEGKNCMVGY